MKKDTYPTIFLSGTDAKLPPWFSNDYQKYSGFKKLSGGGSGVLYSCYDNNMGRTVAIKKIHPDLANDPRESQRLLREARITAQLQHPCTVPVYEIGKDDHDRLYFAMKKVEGEDLYKIFTRIARGDERTIAEYSLHALLGIIQQICNALAFAHSHGVIHRDVKPENILIGLYDQIYLMDWGVAKVWGMPNELSDESSIEATRSQRPGTPLYMSPEQILGNRTIDERTDIFSMGIVLYELLALREPFLGQTIDQTFANIIDYTPEPPSAVAKHHHVSPELDVICMKAIQKQPRDRYQSMTEMTRALRDFLSLSLG
jgi:serine/threonine-protein kinase